jgi:hypothetical protein
VVKRKSDKREAVLARAAERSAKSKAKSDAILKASPALIEAMEAHLAASANRKEELEADLAFLREHGYEALLVRLRKAGKWPPKA